MFNLSFRDKKFKIVQKFGIFVLISLVIILAGAIDMFAVRGMNFGIEFSGGINVEVEARDAENLEDTVTSWLKDNGYVIGGAIQKVGTGLSFRVNSELADGTNLNTTEEGADQTLLVIHSNMISGEGAEYEDGSLKAHLEEKYPNIEIDVTTHVIGNDVKNYTVKNNKW